MSHEDSLLEFDELITSIVGDNDVGKTNLWRAMRLCAHNLDWPEGAVRDGQNRAAISITDSAGHKAERSWTPSGQSIKLTDKHGLGKQFDGKKNVGQYLSDHLGFNKVKLDETGGTEDLNFVEVGADSLLFVGNYASIQRRIAAIVGGSQLEDAKNRLSKELRKARSTLDTAWSQKHRIADLVQDLQFLLQEVQQPSEELTNLQADWEKTNQELLDLCEYEKQILELKDVEHCLSMYDESAVLECRSLLNELDVLQDKKLESLALCLDVEDWESIEQQLAQTETMIQSLKSDLALSPDVCSACGRPL